MITDIFAALVVAAAPPGGGGSGFQPPSAPGMAVRPQSGSTVAVATQEPEIVAAETALKAAEQRAREAQIEVSRRVSEVQEARMGLELARAEVELRQLKAAGKKSIEKNRIKAIESRVSVLRTLIKDDLPAMRDLQARMLKAQTEDPTAASGLQAEMMVRQRTIARKQIELEIATLRAAGADPERIKAMERRLEELKKQAPAGGPAGNPGSAPRNPPPAKSKGKT